MAVLRNYFMVIYIPVKEDIVDLLLVLTLGLLLIEEILRFTIHHIVDTIFVFLPG